MRELSKLLAISLVFSLWVMPIGGAEAKTLFSKTYSYFPIRGSTAQDLDRELATKGPKSNATGMRHPGITRIKFSGSAQYVETPGKCRVQDAQVKVVSNIFLPSWKNRKNAPAGLGLIWDALSSDIKRHEERHAEIAMQHAKGLESALKNLRAEKNCDAMRARVAMATDKAIEAHDRDQRRFDKSEAINFQARMTRLINTRIESQSNKK